MRAHPLLRSSVTFRARPGFTVIEMLVAMTMLLAIMAASMKLLSMQSAAVTGQAGRLDALQNARFALTTIDRELRMAGAGTVDAQPMLVLASRTAIAFNVNLAALDTADEYAVYTNPDADPLTVRVWPASRQQRLPGTTDLYPDTTYTAPGGVPSSAETILFHLVRDSSSRDPEAHVLYRQVNETAPQVVARGILVGPADTVFHYFSRDAVGSLVPVPQARLPLLHLEPEHGAPGDSTRFGAWIDSVRTVRIRLRASYLDSKGERSVRTVESTVRLMNAGLLQRMTCGEPPLGLAASGAPVVVGGVPAARITWGQSLDEAAGERDVERYAVYRRAPASLEFGEPIASMPAGQTSYEYVDTTVRPGDRWVYGVAALDCTPRSSPVTSTGTVTIP